MGHIQHILLIFHTYIFWQKCIAPKLTEHLRLWDRQTDRQPCWENNNVDRGCRVVDLDGFVEEVGDEESPVVGDRDVGDSTRLSVLLPPARDLPSVL